MKRNILITMIISTFIVGCGDTTQVVYNTNESTVVSPAESSVEETSTRGDEDVVEVELPVVDVELPDVYYDVFCKYAKWINDTRASYNIVSAELKATDYDLTFYEPTSEQIGMIEVRDGSDFYVYIEFYPHFSYETIMDVNYGAQGVGEVTASDNAHISEVEYSYLIGTRTKVNSLDQLEQYAKQLYSSQ